MKSTAKDRNEVRTAFASSIMVDTALSSLAQNLDGPDWPIKGKDETPAKYIDLTFEEVIELLQLKGQSPERMDQLVSLLKETLAFDSPFGDMVEQIQAASERDNPLLKNLAKLGIPENFPIALAALEQLRAELERQEASLKEAKQAPRRSRRRTKPSSRATSSTNKPPPDFARHGLPDHISTGTYFGASAWLIRNATT
jgi:hypothetical protein